MGNPSIARNPQKTIKSKILYIHLILLIFLSALIVFFWFKGRHLLATGEEGLWFWNPGRTLELYKYSWVDVGLGYATPFFLPKLPVLFFADIFSKFLSQWVIQAVLFWFLFISAGAGMYFLVGEIMQVKKQKVSLIAGVFYLLNLYTQSQIWRRFLSTSMFAWAYFPLFLFLWIKWAKTGKIKWLTGLLISSLLFSYTFSSPAFIFTFFIPVAIWFVISVFRSKNNVYKLFIRK